MSTYNFNFKFDASAWRAAAGFGDSFKYGPPSGSWLTCENIKVESKSKIRIAPNQPINTSIFEEAIVLEENSIPTAEGLKERLNDHPYFVREGEMKPIIDFINRL